MVLLPSSAPDSVGTGRISPLNLYPGHMTTVLFMASRVKSTPEFRALPQEERDCNYPHEVDTGASAFKEYSIEACWYQCTVAAAERCATMNEIKARENQGAPIHWAIFSGG